MQCLRKFVTILLKSAVLDECRVLLDQLTDEGLRFLKQGLAELGIQLFGPFKVIFQMDRIKWERMKFADLTKHGKYWQLVSAVL